MLQTLCTSSSYSYLALLLMLVSTLMFGLVVGIGLEPYINTSHRFVTVVSWMLLALFLSVLLAVLHC